MIRLVACFLLTVAASSDFLFLNETKQSSRTSRILNGQDASIVNYPYTLIFFFVDRHNRGSLCGAAIISKDWAITSAHCVLNVSVAQLRIHSNITDLNAGGSFEVGVDRIILHPLSEITGDSADYDIALMKVSPAFHFGPGIHPVGLPNQDQKIPPGAIGTITGWGQAVQDEDYPNPSQILQMGTVQLMNQSDCGDIYSNAPAPLNSNVTDRMVCATGESSACLGDSGGPLVVDGQLVGTASWGSEKCHDYPTVFTRVALFRDWIRNITGV